MKERYTKKALILINAYDEQAGIINQSSRLKEEFDKLGVDASIIRNDGFYAYVADDGTIQNKLSGYDFCVYLDKDKYASQALEKSGMRLFNSHAAIQACDDKMTTCIMLAGGGVPMPKTLPGLLCYNCQADVKKSSLDIIEEELKYPLIFKKCYGSLGKGVIKVDDREGLEAVACKFKGIPHLYQQYIAASHGKDIRVIVIGGKAVGGMLRKSQGDFRSNIELGGVGERIQLPQEVIDISERAAKLLKLDYCGVDILIGNDGYYVCEVNSNAFFKGIEAVTGVNIAKAYAEYIIATLRALLP